MNETQVKQLSSILDRLGTALDQRLYTKVLERYFNEGKTTIEEGAVKDPELLPLFNRFKASWLAFDAEVTQWIETTSKQDQYLVCILLTNRKTGVIEFDPRHLSKLTQSFYWHPGFPQALVQEMNYILGEMAAILIKRELIPPPAPTGQEQQKSTEGAEGEAL